MRDFTLSTCSILLALTLAFVIPASGQSPEVLPTPSGEQADARLRDELIKRIGRNPDSPSLLNELGDVAFRLGDFWNSAIALKKADALEPLDENRRFIMAMAFVEIGRPHWARVEITRLAGANPDSPLYPYWLGRLDFDEQRYDDALAHLERALRIHPRFFRAHDRIGLCLQGLGKWDQALEHHLEAVRLNREEAKPSAWPPANLGQALYRLDRLDEAEEALREALSYDAAMPEAHYHLGVLLNKRNRPDEGVKHLERAAELEPGNSKPHYALARSYRRAGETQKAKAALDRFRKLEQEARKDEVARTDQQE